MLLPNKKNKNETIEERYILCIDGGGMRGIIPAVIISKLDEKLKQLDEEKPLYSFFDLITGTSTGGLIALGLSTSPLISNLKKEEGEDLLVTYESEPLSLFEKIRGKKPQKAKAPKLITKGCECSSLLNFYKLDGKSIFHSESRFFGQLLRDKYDPKYIEAFLSRTFKKAKMNQCLVPTMVVSYDTVEGIPFNFTSWDDKGFSIAQAARATSAAPIYFPPAMIFDKQSNKKRYLIDGGIIANNPVLLAYNEARGLYPNCKKFHILSLSTASNEYAMQEIDISGGLMGWIDPSKGAPIQKIASTSQMQLASHIANSISDVDYTRIHYKLKGDSFKLDDTSSYAINTLVDSAEQLYREQEDKLEGFLKKMIKRDDFSHVLDIDKLQINEKIIKEPKPFELPVLNEEMDLNSSEEDTSLEKAEASTKKKYFFNRKSAESNSNIKNKDLSNILEKEREKQPPQIDKYQEVLEKYGFNEEDFK